MATPIENARTRKAAIWVELAALTSSLAGGKPDSGKGGIGHVGVFSLYGNKVLTAGEGGIVVTNNEGIDRRVRLLRSLYFDPNHTFYHLALSWNFRMGGLQAALALAQLKRLDEFLENFPTVTREQALQVLEFSKAKRNS